MKFNRLFLLLMCISPQLLSPIVDNIPSFYVFQKPICCWYG